MLFLLHHPPHCTAASPPPSPPSVPTAVCRLHCLRQLHWWPCWELRHQLCGQLRHELRPQVSLSHACGRAICDAHGGTVARGPLAALPGRRQLYHRLCRLRVANRCARHRHSLRVTLIHHRHRHQHHRHHRGAAACCSTQGWAQQQGRPGEEHGLEWCGLRPWCFSRGATGMLL